LAQVRDRPITARNLRRLLMRRLAKFDEDVAARLDKGESI
jgi:hypothetical protein